jgi:endonuclease/exonuclease/phosphatase family metal-dependent hydrolase
MRNFIKRYPSLEFSRMNRGLRAGQIQVEQHGEHDASQERNAKDNSIIESRLDRVYIGDLFVNKREYTTIQPSTTLSDHAPTIFQIE